MLKVGSALVALVALFSVACVNDTSVDSSSLEGGAMETSPAEAEGGAHRAPEKIQAVVRASFGQFRACYEDALKRDAKLEGKLMLDFKIEASGAVAAGASVGATSTLREAALERCMLDHVAKLTFEAADGTTTVTYPIAFSPG